MAPLHLLHYTVVHHKEQNAAFCSKSRICLPCLVLQLLWHMLILSFSLPPALSSSDRKWRAKLRDSHKDQICDWWDVTKPRLLIQGHCLPSWPSGRSVCVYSWNFSGSRDMEFLRALCYVLILMAILSRKVTFTLLHFLPSYTMGICQTHIYMITPLRINNNKDT